MLDRFIGNVWAFDGNYHNQVFSICMLRLAQGKEPILINEKNREDRMKAASPKTQPISGKVSGLNIAGNVKVISLDGAMSRNGDFCSYGTERIAQFIDEANADPAINAILLKINSGGGDVDGTEQLASKIKTSKKPIVAYVAGMAASAAYWVASQATEIIMESGTTAYVGSIGVLAVHVDATEALAKEGYKYTIVRADGSTDKALWNSVEPLSEQVLADAKGKMNIVKATFEAAVRSGRAKISNDVFTGKMYEGNAAIKKGMADRVGTYEDALSRAMYLARKQELNQNQNQKAMSYMKLEAVLGGPIPEGMSEETATAIEAALVERDNQITAHEATIGANATRIKSLEVAETKLKGYEATKLTVEQVTTLQEWQKNAKAASALGNATDVANQEQPKAVSKATAAAIETYNKLHKK